MGLREDAKAQAAEASREEVLARSEAEGSAGAATNDQIEAATSLGDRHGVPDSNVYDPEKGAYLAPGAPQRELEALRESIATAQGKAVTERPAAPLVVQGTPLHLSPAQHAMLLRPINPNRVKLKQGQSHLEAWDVRRHLTRIFGFGGWRVETMRLDKIFERIIPSAPNSDRFKHTVVYEAQVRLTIFNPDGTAGAVFEDAATGDGINMPNYQTAADFAVKTALSQALKRCAVNLGDQFGLSLYDGGSTSAVINGTLAGPVIEGGSELLTVVSQSGVVRSEQETDSYLSDPGQHADADQETGMPSALSLRDEATNPGTSPDRLQAILKMVHRSKGSHPQYGSTEVTNENGDAEKLDHLVYRKIEERRNGS